MIIENLNKYRHRVFDKNGVKTILINGNSYELIKEIKDKSIDLILTDPPYKLQKNCGKVDEHSSWIHKEIKKYITDSVSNTELGESFDYSILVEMERVCKRLNCLLFCSNLQVADLMGMYGNDKRYLKSLFVNLLVWYKTNAIPAVNGCYHSNIEFIISYKESGTYFNNEASVKEKSKVIVQPMKTGGSRFHPTQKPESVIEHLVKIRARAGDWVLDPFSGSATTAVVCYNMGVNSISIEKEEEYYNKSVNRLEELINKSLI